MAEVAPSKNAPKSKHAPRGRRVPHRKVKAGALAVLVAGAIAAIVVVCVIRMREAKKKKAKKTTSLTTASSAGSAGSAGRAGRAGIMGLAGITAGSAGSASITAIGEPAPSLSLKSKHHGAALRVLSATSGRHTVELDMKDLQKVHEFRADAVQSMHDAKVCVKGRSVLITLPIDVGTAPTGTLHLQGMVDVAKGDVINLGACEAGELFDPPLKFGSTPEPDRLTVVAWNEENKLRGYEKERLGFSVPDLVKTKLIKGDSLCIASKTYTVFDIGCGDAARHNGKYVTVFPKLKTTVEEGDVVVRGPC